MKILIMFFISIGSPSTLFAADNHLIKKLERNPEDIKTRSQLASSYYQSKKFKDVIEILNPYTEQLSIDLYLLLAGSYSETKNFRNEVRILKMVSEKDKNNHNSFFVLGNAYLNLARQESEPIRKRKNFDLAILSLRKSLDLKSNYLPTYDLLLNTFIDIDSKHEARSILNDMLNKFGRRSSYLNDLCRLYSLDGYLNQAIKICREAIQKSKSFPDNFVYLSQSYLDKGDEKASGKFIKIAAKKFKKSEFAQWAAGEFYFKKKNFPVASRYFAAAVKADSTSVRSNLGFAESLFETEKYQKALPFFLNACQKDANARSHLASAAAKLRLQRKISLSKKFERAKYQCR